jgi:hypothetical protein
MNGPVNLKQSDTAVALASDHRMDEIALSLGHEECGFFELIRPHFSDYCTRLLARELIGWGWSHDCGFGRDTNAIAYEYLGFSGGVVEHKQL